MSLDVWAWLHPEIESTARISVHQGYLRGGSRKQCWGRGEVRQVVEERQEASYSKCNWGTILIPGGEFWETRENTPKGRGSRGIYPPTPISHWLRPAPRTANPWHSLPRGSDHGEPSEREMQVLVFEVRLVGTAKARARNHGWSTSRVSCMPKRRFIHNNPIVRVSILSHTCTHTQLLF